MIWEWSCTENIFSENHVSSQDQCLSGSLCCRTCCSIFPGKQSHNYFINPSKTRPLEGGSTFMVLWLFHHCRAEQSLSQITMLIANMPSIVNWSYRHRKKLKQWMLSGSLSLISSSWSFRIIPQHGATSCFRSLATNSSPFPSRHEGGRRENNAEKSDVNIASPALGCVFSLSKKYLWPLAPPLHRCYSGERLRDLEPCILPQSSRGKGWQLLLVLCSLLCCQWGLLTNELNERDLSLRFHKQLSLLERRSGERWEEPVDCLWSIYSSIEALIT